MAAPEIPLGARVAVTAGVGIVRWTGTNPTFSAGKWVGVELDTPTGKNNGSVLGQEYFVCSLNHGVFVRPSQVKILERPPTLTNKLSRHSPTTRPNSSASTSSQVTSTPAAASASSARSKVSRPPSSALTRDDARGSTTASPSPIISRRPTTVTDAPSSSGQPKSQTVSENSEPLAISSRLAVNNNTPLRRVSPAVSSHSSKPASMGPPPVPSERRPSFSQPIDKDSSSVLRAVATDQADSLTPSIGSNAPQSFQLHPAVSPRSDSDLPLASSHNQRELEELRRKIRFLENRRTEDLKRLMDLEVKASDADALRAARIKLQSKFQEQQSALLSAQRLVRDLQLENAHLETRTTEAIDQLEMATLDREVAEERAEESETEAARLGEKISELELEVILLKEENAEYEKPGGEGEQNSMAFLQLEKHNERLKEALIRLRDVSTETEKENRSKINELQRELSLQESLSSKLELAEAKLVNSEVQIDNLKLQLDDALGAEEMLEQLTDSNLKLSEKIEEMRVSIVDLEALKELNDELEENHVETEKQLHVEVDLLRDQLREERARSSVLQGTAQEAESTLSRFRQLVGDLQNELIMLREDRETQEIRSATASKESQALLNLNLKLRSSAVRNQSELIDKELKMVEISQLAQHLGIVQAYLPDTYLEMEAQSTNTLLLFERLSAKVEMLIDVTTQVHGLPDALHASMSEALVEVCELRGKLRHFAALSHRFAVVMSQCDPDDYALLGNCMTEISGVEAKVDRWISLAKVEEFRESECAQELGHLIQQFERLAETSFNYPSLAVGERQLALARSLDDDLDNFAAAVGFARQALSSFAEDDPIEMVLESSLENGIYEPVRRILEQVRVVKGRTRNLVALLESVVQKSSALSSELTADLDVLVGSVSNAVDLAVQLAQRIGAHILSIRESKQLLQLSDIEKFLFEVTSQSVTVDENIAPWEVIGAFITRLGIDIGDILPKIQNAPKAGQIYSCVSQPPWLARSAVVKAAAKHNAEAEKKVVRLTDDLKNMLREVKLRDQNLQEAGVKVETLERRLEMMRRQADTIIDLENDVAKAKKQEKVYEDAIEQLQTEHDLLEAENARLRNGNGGQVEFQANLPPSSGIGKQGDYLGASVGVDSPLLIQQVETLKSAVRYLRSENSLLKARDVYNDIHMLPPYSRRFASNSSLPELDPGEIESDTDSDHLASPTISPARIVQPNARQALSTESKILFREIANFQSVPRIVDISEYGRENYWRSKRNSPEAQVRRWKVEREILEQKVAGLAGKVRALC